MNTSATPVRVPSLEERITARIHESIGDLITDDDLKAMIARGVEQALFKPRIRPGVGQWGSDETLPSVVDEIVAKLLGEKMTAAVEQYLKDNPEKLDAAVKDAIAKGAGACFMSYLDSKFQSVFTAGVSTLQMQGLLPRV